MTQVSTKRKSMQRIELAFDLLYLLVVLIAGILLYIGAQVGSLRWQYGIMALVLVAGDSFHLVPRMCSIINKDKDYTSLLGVGKLVTSITMTIFYIILWEIGKGYYGLNVLTFINLSVYGFAILRILLCFFPQNQWTKKNPSLKWGIIRNIPFTILGIIVMIYYIIGAIKIGGSLSFMWLVILISFACYLPVVLFAKKNPKVGMLMLPKSCAYVAIVLMGFLLV